MCDKKLKLLIVIAGTFKQPMQFEHTEVFIFYLPWLLGTSDQKLMSKNRYCWNIQGTKVRTSHLGTYLGYLGAEIINCYLRC
jgi:hypothetical protein